MFKMKNKIPGIAIFAISLAACNSSSDKTNETKINDSTQANTHPKSESVKEPASINGVISGYLQLKNALVNDNGTDAANAGKTIMNALEKIDTASFSAEQKKIFKDVADDIKENAEHCSVNGNKIEHQREHFEMLSQDMYDLVKAFAGTQILYRDFCPMYNNGKGGMWISEIKEIKNPYLGKKMPTCGEVKEEIK